MAGQPKPNAPHFHTVYPDYDKLLRVVLDALKHGGMYHDDSQVCALLAGEAKIYGEEPGVWIRLQALEHPKVYANPMGKTGETFDDEDEEDFG